MTAPSSNYLTFILATLIAGGISLIATPVVILFAKKFDLVDDLKKRKHPAHTHTGIIPRAGGIPLFLGIFIAVAFFIPLYKVIIGILLGGFLTVVVGILDDRYDVSPYVRFFFNFLIAGVTILFGLGIPYIGNPLGGVIRLDTVVLTVSFFGSHTFLLFANLFAIFWIVTLMNFVNWSKGVDGQMPGFVAISSFFLGVLALRFTGHHIPAVDVSILAFITFGSFVGFLYHNMYPQRIMPGYGGGALAGFMLAVLSILSWAKLGTLLLVLSIPFVDALYVIVRRLAMGRSPFYGDAGHFHHRLLQIGWGKKRIATFYWLVSLLLGVSSLFLQGMQKLLALIFVSVCLAIFIRVTETIRSNEEVQKITD